MHEIRFYEIKDDIKLIAVAGPSSSGKTTFTNRLRIELLSRGIKPMMISMDNYYKPKHEAPKDSDGNPDLEHVEALDVEQFSKDMAEQYANSVPMPNIPEMSEVWVGAETMMFDAVSGNKTAEESANNAVQIISDNIEQKY